jgi:hypothetical protein
MIATALRPGSRPANSGRNRWALIARNLIKSSRSRNWCNIFASGSERLFAKKAKSRHARFSASNSTSRLKEWAGVNRLSKSTRNSWAGEKAACRP